MKVTVFNKKGGAGKTPISYALAKDFGFHVATNEMDTYDGLLPASQYDVVDFSEPFKEYDDSYGDIVFDLSGSFGKTASSILSAVEQCDVIVIPVFNDPVSVKGFYRTVTEVSSYQKNIITVVTKIERSSADKNPIRPDYTNAAEFIEIKEYVDMINNDLGLNIRCFPTSKTKMYSRMLLEGKSMSLLLKESPLQARSWKNSVVQFNNFYDYMRGQYE